MNLATTYGVTTEGKFVPITLPHEASFGDQRRAFRKHVRRTDEFVEVQLWTTALGRVKKRKTSATPLPETQGEDEKVPENHESAAASPDSADGSVAPEGTPSSPEASAAPASEGSAPAPATPPVDKKAAALAKARAARQAKSNK